MLNSIHCVTSITESVSILGWITLQKEIICWNQRMIFVQCGFTCILNEAGYIVKMFDKKHWYWDNLDDDSNSLGERWKSAYYVIYEILYFQQNNFAFRCFQ